MQRQRLITLFALFTLVATPSVAAAERRLTLNDALALSEQNYEVAKAQEARKGLDGRYVEERSAALPQLTANLGASLAQDESQQLFGPAYRQQLESAELSLSQPLYTWGKIGAAIRAARVALQSGDEAIRSARQSARRDVTAAFYELLLAGELYRLAIENLHQRERHQQEAQRRFDAGVATDYDILAASVDVENARPVVIRAENGIRTAGDRLAYLLALSDTITADGSLAVTVAEPLSLEEALRRAATQRPELAGLRLQQEARREVVKIYGAEDKPRLDLRGSAGWRRLEIDNPLGPLPLGTPRSAAADGSAWNAGLYLSWPFFDGLKTRGKVMQAKSEVAQLVIDEQALADSIAIEVRNARNAMLEAGAIVTAAARTVEQAQRLLAMAEKGFEFGVKTRIDVDDAQVNLLQAQTSLARGQRDYLVAQAQFAWATGAAL